jgi:mediator of RNA polymerase II transcription subunit 12
VSRGDNFVSPRSWQKYKQTLGACLLSNGNDSSARYRLIDLRNRWLSRSQEDMIPSSRQKLISLFDKSLRSPYHSEMATECKQTTSDLTLLGRIILDWCTSAQRPGVTKVYVAARLLRSCIRLETGITLILLDFLGARDHGDGFCKQSLYHVISELARSGHFVISKYLRWLIARGGVRSSEDIAPEGPCATRLLAELPVDDSLDGIDMLRTTIMHRATESTSIGGSERHAGIIDLEDLLAEAAKPIEATKGWEPSIRIKEVANRLSRKSRSEKAETGTWIRQKVCQFMPPSPASSPEDWKGNKIGGANTITHNEFILVRAVLESIEDFSMLADVLKMCTHSEDVQVLASIADTLYYHCETFAAIGALEELFERLLIRLRTRSEDSDMTQLQRSMCHLAGKIPGAEAVATQLSQELLQLHHKTAADACSPVSDHMTERLDVSESQFVDEVDKVIASGTSMDQATMQRLFDMVTGRLQASWCSPDPQISNSCATLLSKLKCFDVQHFGKLARVWVNKVVATPNRPGLRDIFASLIAQDCVEFKELTRELRTFLDDYVSTENTPAARQSVRDVLVFIVGSASKTENLFYEDGYRLRAMRLSMQATLASDIIAIIKRCVELSPELSCGEPDENSSLYGSEAMRIFFQRAVLRNPDLVTRDFVLPLVWNSHPDCRAVVGELMKCWLALDPASVGLTWDAAHHIEQILRSADELNLPFCQVALRSFVVDDVVERGKGDEEPLGYMAAFERAMDKAIQGDDKSWMIIVPLLDAKIASHVYHRAESLLLQLIPSLPSDEPAVESRDENENRARRLLSILSATSDGIKVDPNASLTSQVVDKLSDLWGLLMQGDIRSRNSAIELWLPVLLDLVIFHATYWDNSKSSSEFRSRILLCLASFLLELQGRGHNHPLLLQQIFDVSLLLVDDLPEDARSNCVRSLKDKTSDSRIQYIFGYSTASMDWMQLNQKGKLMAYPFRRWEILSEPTPNVGENDTSLSLTLFNARRV